MNNNLKLNYDDDNIYVINNEQKFEFYNTDDALEFIYNIYGHYSPLSVYFELTNCCNFKCPFCYINYSDENKKILKTDKLIKNIDFLCEQGMVCATLSGGECLLHPDFKKIYTYLYEKNILITVLTNGTLINDDIIELWKNKKPFRVEISLYGSDNEKMQNNTKQNNYSLDNLKNIILLLKKNKIKITCKMPVNKITSNSFIESLNWCKNNDIDFYFSDELFNKYNGNCNDEYILDDETIKKIVEKNKYSLYKKMDFQLNKKKKCFDCKAGKYSMILSYDNYIYPCFEFRQVKEGIFKINNNINEAYKNLYQYITSFKNIELNKCQGCTAYSICQDCVINHIKNKYNCKYYQNEREKIMNNLNKMNNQLIKKYDTKELMTNRLILKKGTSKDCIKIYEYDMLKCRGIAGEEELEKSKEEVDFIGNNPEEYYKECALNKMFDWYVYLKDGTPIANVTADREIEKINSIELAFNMHPDYWKKGYMKEAVTKIIDYLFEIGYSNIIIGYDEGNYKSKSFAESLGFKKYQIIEKSYQKNGINIDTVLMIMSKEDWNK